MDIRFLSLGSGSCGNCYFIGTASYGILIDAGIGIRSIKKYLAGNGIAWGQIKALLITHDHADHIKSAGNVGEKNGIPVYCTELMHQGMNRNYCMTQKLSNASVRYITKEEPFMIEDFKITAFEVSHDGTDNVGYCIEINGKTITIATDIGQITATALHYLNKANYLILEANYDAEMLKNGPYPSFLKERISNGNGHLCNDEMAQYIKDHYRPTLKHVWLCHLSAENNHPTMAQKSIEQALTSIGVTPNIDIQVTVLKRTSPSVLYLL